MANDKQKRDKDSLKKFMDDLRNDPATLGFAYLKQGPHSKIARPDDVLLKNGATLDGKRLHLTVTNGLVIIKDANLQKPKTF